MTSLIASLTATSGRCDSSECENEQSPIINQVQYQCMYLTVGVAFSYSQVCSAILQQKALPEEKFAMDMLPSLLALGNDPVANVRISLAKTLRSCILVSGTS